MEYKSDINSSMQSFDKNSFYIIGDHTIYDGYIYGHET